MTNVTVVRQALEANRKNANQSFKEIMYSVEKLTFKVGAEIIMPKTCGRQTKRVTNIKKLVPLFATLPVTSATFSVLKRLKTYLRTTMTEERLNGSDLATINKDDLDIEDIEKYILPAFIKRSPRRLKTLDWTK